MMKTFLLSCLIAACCFCNATASAEAVLTAEYGVTYRIGGAQVITGDTMSLSNDTFSRTLASIERKDTTRKLFDDKQKLLRENKGIKCLTSIRNTGEYSEIAWEYEIDPNPEGKYVQLRLAIPADVFPELPPRSPAIRRGPDSGAIEVDSYLGGLRFDGTGSTGGWTFEDLRHVAWSKQFRLLFTPEFDPQTGSKGKAVLRITTVPSRSAAFHLVPVVKYGNQGLTDEHDNDGKGGWTDQGANDLRSFQPGVIAAQGIPFAIGDKVIVLRGTMRMRFPVKSAVIPMDGVKAERLAFCHTVAWGAQYGKKVFEYVITYEDGKEEIFPVLYQKDVVDWWGGQEALNARQAWRGVNGEAMVAIQHAQWKNPRPEAPIKSIQAVSAIQPSVPVILGITAVKTGMLTLRQQTNLSSIFDLRPNTDVDLSKWYSCPLDWSGKIEAGSALDVSFLNHAPAGKYGFVKVGESGHFEFEQRPGEKIRFWGVNFVGFSTFPSKELAPKLAATYARQGVNLVRFHQIFRSTPHSESVLKDIPELRYPLVTPEGKFDPDTLDRLEYFIAQLKAHGIYIYMDWIDGLPLANLLRNPKLPGGNDIVLYATISPEYIEGAKRFAEMLFTRKNPYTGLSMAEDPAFAMFEIINECSFTWTSKPLDKWFSPFLPLLEERWQKWQQENHIEKPVPLTGMPQESMGEPGRRFFTQLQRSYLEEMKSFLRTLGIRVPICGTNLTLTTGDLWASQNMDFTNDHAYYSWAYATNRPPDPKRESVVDTPPIAFPFFPEMVHARVAGKPLVGGEWCFAYPGPFRCEGLPLMAAYYSLQDWDGMLFFASMGPYGLKWRHLEEQNSIRSLSQQLDPSTWGLSQAAALAIRRGDIRTARNTVVLKYTDSDIFNNRRYANIYSFLGEMAKVEIELLAPGEKSDWPVVNSASHAETYFEAAKRFGIEGATTDYLTSDTGEIRRYSSPGLFLVDTPKTQMACGALYSMTDKNRRLGAFQVNSPAGFAALTFSSLDDLPLRQSKRILVCAVGDSRNKFAVIENGMHKDFGKGPVLTEPLEIEISTPASAGNPLKAYALNPTTGAREKELAVRSSDGRETFKIGKNAQTIYFELIR